MTISVWQAGTLYPTGSVVRPAGTSSPTSQAPDNPSYESGDTGWTKPAPSRTRRVFAKSRAESMASRSWPASSATFSPTAR